MSTKQLDPAKKRKQDLIKISVAALLGLVLLVVVLWPSGEAEEPGTAAVASPAATRQPLQKVQAASKESEAATFREVSFAQLIESDPFQSRAEELKVHHSPESPSGQSGAPDSETENGSSEEQIRAEASEKRREIRSLVANVIMETANGRVAMLGNRLVEVGTELEGGFVVTDISETEVLVEKRLTTQLPY